ncbi:MAG: cytidine deaminase [Clostridioides sp.]|jgi:cytidine deaminase|nr:cytidine deaminase [Clostridioides sp.]
MDNRELLEIAENARKFSYSPYSKFRVGAAVLTEGGKVFTGCNIECASFGGTNCAERVAVFKAVSEGHRDIAKIAISSDNSEEDKQIFPCGICRQVIFEFGMDIKIVTGYSKGKVFEYGIGELLPHSFTGDDF